jgi:hypothetical protein
VVKTSSVEVPRSPEWWAKHTVIRHVVTHLNEHGARVLFTLPERGLTLVAETAGQAERQLAYARERWPEGVYEVHEVRFWREANGNPGDPVHTLIEKIGGHTPSGRTICVEQRSNDFRVYDGDNHDVWGCGSCVSAAIGDLVLTHAATFGLQIDYIDPSSDLED